MSGVNREALQYKTVSLQNLGHSNNIRELEKKNIVWQGFVGYIYFKQAIASSTHLDSWHSARFFFWELAKPPAVTRCGWPASGSTSDKTILERWGFSINGDTHFAGWFMRENPHLKWMKLDDFCEGNHGYTRTIWRFPGKGVPPNPPFYSDFPV